MDRLDKYLHSLEQQQEKWKNEIKKFRVIAEVANKDAQVEHYQIIEGITNDLDRFSQKLEELDNASSANKDKLKDELQTLKERIDQVIESARCAIN